MQPINRAVHKGAVSVATTAGGTDLLTAAEQATVGMAVVSVYPDADFWIIYNSTGTAANSPYLCPANALTNILHTAGPLKGITASGTATVRVAIGVGP